MTAPHAAGDGPADRPADGRLGAAAGYSGTPLHRKLGVRPGHRVLVIGAPAGFPLALLDGDGAARLAAVPVPPPPSDRAGPTDEAGRAAPWAPPADVVLAFCPDVATLHAVLGPALAATAEPGGRCWIGRLKKASAVPTDLTEDAVRAAGLAAGWVDVKVCAIDPLWSGTCLMRRTRSRSGPLRQGDGRTGHGRGT